MRELNSNRVSQLVQISGIITSASKPKVRQLGQQQRPQSTGSCHVAAAQATCAYVPCAVGNQVSMSLG
jgi:DNA replicative helicase MCM subunit Mcm2 (Cdc46/Mcm family)